MKTGAATFQLRVDPADLKEFQDWCKRNERTFSDMLRDGAVKLRAEYEAMEQGKQGG